MSLKWYLRILWSMVCTNQSWRLRLSWCFNTTKLSNKAQSPHYSGVTHSVTKLLTAYSNNVEIGRGCWNPRDKVQQNIWNNTEAMFPWISECLRRFASKTGRHWNVTGVFKCWTWKWLKLWRWLGMVWRGRRIVPHPRTCVRGTRSPKT